MLRIIILALALAGGLRAQDEDFKPEDALYAPEELTATSEDALSPAPQGGSFYSNAKIVVADFSRPGKLLEGAELFIDGQYLGRSPLQLSGLLISKPAVALSARLSRYDEALRPALRFPADGEVRISVMGDHAVSWYTLPSWLTGLLMFGGAVAAYSQNTPEASQIGISLVAAGVGVIAISQGIARLLHLPSLRKDLEALNSKTEPQPQPQPGAGAELGP